VANKESVSNFFFKCAGRGLYLLGNRLPVARNNCAAC